jgi:hypothetical protein
VLVLNMTYTFSVIYFCLMMINISWISYFILVDPFLNKEDSVREIVNACIFMFFTYFIPAYTFMTPDAEVRYFLGFYTIYVVGGLILINFIWVIISLIQDKCKQKVYKAILD